MRNLKGSFTLEGVIIIPMILFLLISVLEQGIDFYKAARDRTVSELITDWDAVSVFYDVCLLKEINGEVEDE